MRSSLIKPKLYLCITWNYGDRIGSKVTHFIADTQGKEIYIKIPSHRISDGKEQTSFTEAYTSGDSGCVIEAS